MATYAERIERYMAAHPGATIAEARGHGHTPERPGGGRSEERFESYYERRDQLESHTNRLKEDLFGNLPSWNPDGAKESTGKIPLDKLEQASHYDSLEDYANDQPNGWDDLDEDFGYYH